MHIVFLLQDVSALYGAERATLLLARGLRGRGMRVSFVLLHESRLGPPPLALARALNDLRIDYHTIPVSGRISAAAVRRCRELFEQSKGTILHTTGYKAVLHALLCGVRPLVATVHGWLFRRDLKERFYESLEKFALRRFDAVICLSRYYEEKLLKVGIDRGRLWRIPTGYPTEDLPSASACAWPPPEPFTVLHVGRFSEEKNHDLLLRAVARLAGEGHRLQVLLAGEGPLRPQVERRIQQLGLAEQVICTGYQPLSELVPRAHALVLCSTIENLPMSLLEAMAWNRPVVATRVGGIPDLVEDGRTGFMVDAGNESALAEALRRLMAAPDVAAEMGRAGRKKLECEFSFDQMIERHCALYTGVLRRAG
ncbi:MAG: glycosyltransferase [Kiritimatiellae bacterium]|nr:glycosyltransferase [Kiritimatiellia bacterium]MDW8459541.1 glycosyltransferase [Verrucomicrobiota bacterium]